MNCPFKRNHIRFLSLLLIFVMIIGMFAGCKKEEPADTTPSSEENVPPGLVEVKPTEAETTPTTEATEPMDANAAIINKDDTDVRQTPSTDANPIGKLNKGTQVTIIREVSIAGVGWTLIREGWVKTEALDKSAAAEQQPQDTPIQTPAQMENQNGNTENNGNAGNTGSSESYIGYITANPELNIRKDANQNSARVGAYKKGDKVTILETKNGWGRTDKGWISLSYVGKSPSATTGTNTNTNNNTGTTTTGGTKGIVLTELNIRKEASQNSDRVGGYTVGNQVTILETSGGWGRTDKGWISLNYVYQEGTNGTNACNGVVIGNGVNVRSGPGTGYNRVDSKSFGQRVNVLQRITIGETTWGYIKGGWISMDYVYVDGTESTGAGEGTCNADGVNIRSGPGTAYGVVGSANTNDALTIYTQIEISEDNVWGYVAKGNVKGWMSMQYANMG